MNADWQLQFSWFRQRWEGGRICYRCHKSWLCCSCRDVIKNSTWFTLWSHFLLVTRLPSSIPRFFERLFNFFQRLVLQPGNPLCVAPSFLETQNAILKHTTFCNLAKAHIYLQYKELAVLHFFVFYQGVDGVNCLQETVHLETLNVFLNGKHDSTSFWQSRLITFVSFLADWMTLWRNSFLRWIRNQL